ncbi:MAG: HEAT repeat domain-containing protein [Deltaproteobacteria bacterium]|nr:MAG: HEAT repeat domain-containing protein [Deltaproteobacteria bacterium]
MPEDAKKASRPGPSDPKIAKGLENFLLELSKAIKAVEFYPTQHPALMTVVKRVHELFKIASASVRGIDLSISRQGFQWKQKPLAERNQSLQFLANRLFLRRVSRIKFSDKANLDEFRILLVALTISPEELLGMGGVDKFLRNGKVLNIEISEIRYELVREKVDAAQPGIELSQLEEEDPSKAPLESGKQLLSDEEKLLELLEQLENEEEDDRFLELLKKIVELVGSLTERGEFNVHCQIFRALMRLHRAMGYSPAQKRYCLDALRNLGNRKALDFILSCLGPGDPVFRNELRESLLTIGEAAINPLILRILENKVPENQRYLIDLLHQFGKTAAPRLEAMLADENPSVVRKVLSFLGEIGAENSIAPLGELLYHKNSGVIKEVVKILSRLRSEEARDHLFTALSQADPEIKIHIASTLGDVKESSAVPVLMKLVKRKGRDPQTLSLKKEAINSLGKIGSPEASPLLARVLKRKIPFVRRRMNELQVAAALNLGEIGGEEAFVALERGTRFRHKELRDACWQGIGIINDRFV